MLSIVHSVSSKVGEYSVDTHTCLYPTKHRKQKDAILGNLCWVNIDASILISLGESRCLLVDNVNVIVLI